MSKDTASTTLIDMVECELDYDIPVSSLFGWSQMECLQNESCQNTYILFTKCLQISKKKL